MLKRKKNKKTSSRDPVIARIHEKQKASVKRPSVGPTGRACSVTVVCTAPTGSAVDVEKSSAEDDVLHATR